MLMNLGIGATMAMAGQPGGGGGAGQANWLTTLMPLAVIFAIFYFLMIRPQQKQQKKHRDMIAALKKGDRVVTRGGVLGTVYGIADNIITLEVCENVRLKFTREAISGVQNSASE